MYTFLTAHKPLTVLVILLALVALLVISQFMYIKTTGGIVPVPDIPRNVQTLGNRPETVRYVVLGDSTSVSQGGVYSEGYAHQSAIYLTQARTVQLKNVGVSGARAKDVADNQITEAIAFRPDIALIAVGANDVTHLTDIGSVVIDLKRAIEALRQANPDIKIVLTGSPDMGSVPRLPQPARWLAGQRTKAMNKAIRALVEQERITFAPIAEKTGPTFREHPELFAADKFHPTTDGYKVWTPVIIDALKRL